MGLEVGQKLWLVLSRNSSHQQEVTVTKVGRKWATLDHGYRPYRIDKESMEVDGGQYMSPGRCHLSRDEYERAKKRGDDWSSLLSAIRNRWSPPPRATSESIAEARKLLGLDEP